MSTFPFVLSFSLKAVSYAEAEELLAEYGDFYNYNIAQYQSVFSRKVLDCGEIDDQPDEDDRAALEKDSTDNVAEFTKQWGSRDFVNACMYGLSIKWEEIQKILFDEQSKNIKVRDSSLKPAANKIRCLASLLSFIERTMHFLYIKKADSAVMQSIEEGFANLIDRLRTHELVVPEFCKEHKNFMKANTKEKILAYANSIIKKIELESEGNGE
ncbi:MAG: hypothetical protein LBH47_03320 [Christensenellaceae bacterium]|jgi:hypothetical protein|nr:hypothetical protein [Christensenellaceae bacterium]